MEIDEQKVEEAVGKVFGELGVAITGPLIVLGDRLGLWAAMAQPGAAALGAMAGEARLRQVLTEAGYPNVRRVAQQAAPFNIVLEARP
jgi:hypothetical protein